MFDIGFFELVLIFVIGLLVLGPERLPVVARKVGYWTGRARATFNNLRYELEREAHNRDMQERFRKQMEELGIDEETFIRETSGRQAPKRADAPADTSATKSGAAPDASDDNNKRS